MAKQLDTVSDPKREKPKGETNSLLKNEYQPAEFQSPLEDEDHLEVRGAQQEGFRELVGQQRSVGEKAAPAALQQPPVEDQHRHLHREEPINYNNTPLQTLSLSPI